MSNPSIRNVVFDLGAVLVDWNPRYLYDTLSDDPAKIDFFLNEVCPESWNHTLDLGRDYREALDERIGLYPEHRAWIEAYWHRWLEMFSGPVHESVDILMFLKKQKTPLYALSNWNDVKFQVALEEFPFLRLFDGRIVSGEVKLAKPDPAIYQLLLEKYELIPEETLFIDDRSVNVEAACRLGIAAVQFISPSQLERDLIRYGVIEGDADAVQSQQTCGDHCTCHAQ
ncbi:MAG: HAD family phosphatase [Pseudobdellovibrionaceae bacterium]